MGTGLTAASSGDLSSQIAVTRSAASSLSRLIAADSGQIAATGDGVTRAQRRLATIEVKLGARTRRLAAVQESLLTARDRLIALENRMQSATRALAANLVARYETGQPNLMSVVVNAGGFSQLLDQISFDQRVANQNATIVGDTRATRAQVSAEAVALERLERRDRDGRRGLAL